MILKEIAVEGLDLSMANPVLWDLVAMVRGSLHNHPLPSPVMACGDCGRDWLREYKLCPVCESPDMRSLLKGTG